MNFKPIFIPILMASLAFSRVNFSEPLGGNTDSQLSSVPIQVSIANPLSDKCFNLIEASGIITLKDPPAGMDSIIDVIDLSIIYRDTNEIFCFTDYDLHTINRMTNDTNLTEYYSWLEQDSTVVVDGQQYSIPYRYEAPGSFVKLLANNLELDTREGYIAVIDSIEYIYRETTYIVSIPRAKSNGVPNVQKIQIGPKGVSFLLPTATEGNLLILEPNGTRVFKSSFDRQATHVEWNWVSGVRRIKNGFYFYVLNKKGSATQSGKLWIKNPF